MRPQDVFLGPLLRRAQPDLVVICLATFVPMNLRFSVRRRGTTAWLAHDDAPLRVRVTPVLTFHFAHIRPASPLPTGALLEYGIGLKAGGNVDYAPFEEIVETDRLSYGDDPLPTFTLQSNGAPLRLLYGSCRKIHDTDGGRVDSFASGDAQVARTFSNAASRPAILCLGGDQVYADDVDDVVRQEITVLSRRLEAGAREALPDAAGMGPTHRDRFLKRYAKFTSDEMTNHVARFSEYLALYGLMWNPRNWYGRYRELEHFTSTLPRARRLLANVPTYMIFDDHDVTDDWNLDLRWKEEVSRAPLGKRIVANALMAYWLCQGYGNDPDGFGPQLTRRLADHIERRSDAYGRTEEAFWRIDRWEFATPTKPFVYFLDTRTQRGARDEPAAHQPGAPAFLKSVASWQSTVRRLGTLLGRQGPSVPLVLVSAAPVFGFRWVEALQAFVSSLFGAYKYDFENWAANEEHFSLFLRLLAGRNVVVLSGDVHYGFSSTVRYVEFDSLASRRVGPRRSATGGLPVVPGVRRPSYRPTSEAQFVQLCSSAIKNYGGGFFTRFPAWLSSTQPARIETDDGQVVHGRYERGVFIVSEPDPSDPLNEIQRIRQPDEVRPVRLFRQRINDAFNSEYVGDHNMGLLSIRSTAVEHCFLLEKGRHSEHRWDFSNPRYWE